MKKLLYITNIPTPYRQKRFNEMAKILPDFDFELEVLYMSKNEPNRKWNISNESYQYNYKIYKGIHPTIGNIFAHFNPGLLKRLLLDNYDVAVVGGMANPTLWLAPFFIKGNKKQIMSIESNLFSVKRKMGIGFKLKNLLLRKADAYQVTGKPQIDYIKFFNNQVQNKPFIKLPNLIDEDIFVDKVQKLRQDREGLRKIFYVDNDTQMWVLPARLIKIKGIIPFLNLLKDKKGYKLFILGDGELHDKANTLIKKEKLNVILVGFIQQDEVIRYYAAADLFVLPSFKDPSPLSPIEASAAKLPLLVSNRIGNKDDLIEQGVNGWSFDPKASREKNTELINKILEKKNSSLKEMGQQSFINYLKKFNTKKCLINYINQIKLFIENEN